MNGEYCTKNINDNKKFVFKKKDTVITDETNDMQIVNPYSIAACDKLCKYFTSTSCDVWVLLPHHVTQKDFFSAFAGLKNKNTRANEDHSYSL